MHEPHGARMSNEPQTLNTGDLDICLHQDGTLEISDGTEVLVHMTEEETSKFLRWIDGRNRAVSPTSVNYTLNY